MKIVKINKSGLFYKVYFDTSEAYKFHESVIIKYSFLRRGLEVSKDVLELAKLDNEYHLALDKGIKYLEVLHTKYETIIYLRKFFDSNLVTKVVHKLEDLKLINDFEYVKSYVQKSKNKCYGPKKISNDLEQFKVEKEYINLALNDYSFQEQIISCEKLLNKYLPNLKKESILSGRRKITNFMLGKGFSNEIITIVLEKNNNLLDNISDDDTLLEKAYDKIMQKKGSSNERDFKNKVIRSLTNKGFQLSKVLKIVERRREHD